MVPNSRGCDSEVVESIERNLRLIDHRKRNAAIRLSYEGFLDKLESLSADKRLHSRHGANISVTLSSSWLINGLDVEFAMHGLSWRNLVQVLSRHAVLRPLSLRDRNESPVLSARVDLLCWPVVLLEHLNGRLVNLGILDASVD